MPQSRYFYFLDNEPVELRAELKDVIGNKGMRFADLANLSVQIPPGFILTKEAISFFKKKEVFPAHFSDELAKNIKKIEKICGREFGAKTSPLLVNLRMVKDEEKTGSSSVFHVENLGVSEDWVLDKIQREPNSLYAVEQYLSFVNSFSRHVLGLDSESLQDLQALRQGYKKKKRGNLTETGLKALLIEYKKVIRKNSESDIPDSPNEQLKMAFDALFQSFIHSFSHSEIVRDDEIQEGFFICLQAEVLDEWKEGSLIGSVYSRNPENGEKKISGFIEKEPMPVSDNSGSELDAMPIETLKKESSERFLEITDLCQKLENRFREMQKIDFVIQDGILSILDVVTADRSPAAAIRIAVDMVHEGSISKKEALMRIPADKMDQIFHPMVSPNEPVEVLGEGLGVSPGAAYGKAVFSLKGALELAKKRERAIFVCTEITSDDLPVMNEVQGVLSAKGGMTSLGAMTARSMGKPYVSSMSYLSVDNKKKKARLGKKVIKEFDPITLDGSDGKVIAGQASIVQPRLTGVFTELMVWANQMRTLDVRANADTAHDAQVARDFGATGVGLCRTEQMLQDPDRIVHVRRVIVSRDNKERDDALKKLLSIQRADFHQIFKVMEGLPVAIRLFDPPLHKFLPKSSDEIKELAKQMELSPAVMKKRILALKEENTLLGLRGCRLGIAFPELYQMQIKAIFEAGHKLVRRDIPVEPEIIVPLVSHVEELTTVRRMIDEIARDIDERSDVSLSYKVGAMIELPRSAITADEIAKVADFFTFGTNDLTQNVFGLSRDDSGSFLFNYVGHGLLKQDPFVSLDQNGVGAIIGLAKEKARSTNAKIKLGVCGEQGGDPQSIDFLNDLGLDHVSCSPYRVCTALLAAAQAQTKNSKLHP